MRLLHYPGRQNIKYYGAQTLGFLLFMTVCLGCRIITNELWADKTNNLLSTRLFPMADIKWPICDILLSKKSSQQPLRCVSDYLCVQCSLSVRVFVNVDANLYPIPPQRRVPWTLWFVSPQVILCHLCVRYLPPPLSPTFGLLLTPLLIHLVTSLRPQTCKQLTQSRRKTVRLKIICSDDLWIKSMGGRRLCYISTSIPVILEFISIENQSQTVYLKDLWVKRPDENRISEMTLEFYIENHFSTHSTTAKTINKPMQARQLLGLLTSLPWNCDEYPILAGPPFVSPSTFKHWTIDSLEFYS